MQVVDLTRKFQYNSITLPDPNGAFTPDQVKEFYATQYPELTNSVIEGPTTKAGVATYKFTRAVGSKGAHSAAEVIARAQAMQSVGQCAALLDLPLSDNDQSAANLIAATATSKARGQPLPVPAQAFGMWG